jgi:asparagine synthetase B (glutamine-hydrolysing)
MSAVSFIIYKGNSGKLQDLISAKPEVFGTWSVFKFKSFHFLYCGNIQELKELNHRKWRLNAMGQLSATIQFDEQNQEFSICNSIIGAIPIYYFVTDDGIWLTSEIKHFIQTNIISLQLRPFSYLSYSQYILKIKNTTLLEGVFKLPAQHTFTSKGETFSVIDKSDFLSIKSETYKDNYSDELYQLLNKQIEPIEETSIGLTLSGGYDSGSLAGMLSKRNCNFQTYSIGMQSVNEFASVDLICDYFKLINTKIILSEKQYLLNYVQTLYLNEINDTIIAEAFPALYQLYQNAQGNISTFYLGYGADILLSNIVQADEANINSTAWEFLGRTSTSGELAPYLADKFGISLRMPYLTEPLIRFCFSIPDSIKEKDGINKYVQHQMIEKNDLLPPSLLHQKKLGLNVGAGIPEMFSQMLGNGNNVETKKKWFLYNCWKELFIQGKAIENCDISLILDHSKTYEDD